MLRAAAHFPRDAQDVPNAEWLAYGLERGWSPLCKDGRIKGRHSERAPLDTYGAVLFYLDNQRLLVKDMVRRFHEAQGQIYRAVARADLALASVSRYRGERTCGGRSTTGGARSMSRPR